MKEERYLETYEIIRNVNNHDLTQHAKKRMAQRNLSLADIGFVLSHGQAIFRTGVVFIFLGRNDMPREKRKYYAWLEGATVLLDVATTEIITVYRNRNGLRRIKRKNKYSVPGERLHP